MPPSSKKNKVSSFFRLDAPVAGELRSMLERNPLIFSSQARVVNAALAHFQSLSEKEQTEILKTYLSGQAGKGRKE